MAKDSQSCVPSTSTTDHAKANPRNRRKFIRYNADEHCLTWIQFPDSAPAVLQNRAFPCLVIDESRVSMSCSIVLPDFEGEVSEIIWHETKFIKSRCKIVRISHLANRVYILVFNFNEKAHAP